MTEDEKNTFLKEVYNRGFEYEKKYGFCSQAVVGALQDYFEGIDDQVFKAVHPLAGGGALCCDGSCGALMGAAAAVGCFFGRSRNEFAQKSSDGWTKSSLIAKKIREEFIEEFDSVICGDIQTKKMGRDFDLWDNDDFKKFEEAGAHTEHCPDVTGKTAAIAARILLEHGINPRETAASID